MPTRRTLRQMLIGVLLLALLDLGTKCLAVACLPSDFMLFDWVRPTGLGNLGLVLSYHPWGENASGELLSHPILYNLAPLPLLAMSGILLFYLRFVNYLSAPAWYHKFTRFYLVLTAAGYVGNMTSLFLWSRGVPDFLTISEGATIFNLADVFVYLGMACLAPPLLYDLTSCLSRRPSTPGIPEFLAYCRAQKHRPITGKEDGPNPYVF